MKKVAVFLADGCEETEALIVVNYLRRAGIKVDMIYTQGKEIINGDHNIIFKAEKSLDDIAESDYDCFVVPGGMGGANALAQNKKVLDMIKKAHALGKYVCAICAGPKVLINAGILNGRTITGYPGLFEDGKDYSYKVQKVVRDKNVITAMGPSLAVYFALEIIEALGGRALRDEISAQILLEYMERN